MLEAVGEEHSPVRPRLRLAGEAHGLPLVEERTGPLGATAVEGEAMLGVGRGLRTGVGVAREERECCMHPGLARHKEPRDLESRGRRAKEPDRDERGEDR